MQDFIIGNIKTELTEKKKVIITKVLAMSYGVLAYFVVFLVKYLPGVLEAALGIFGIVGGPVLGAFTLGMFVPWCNSIVSYPITAGDFITFKLSHFPFRERSWVVLVVSFSPCGSALVKRWLGSTRPSRRP